MPAAVKFLAAILLTLAAQGCSGLSEFRASAATAIATPGTGLLPPTPGTITETDRKLRDLPPPQAPVAVAVYGYGDQTGQFKPLAQGAHGANPVARGHARVHLHPHQGLAGRGQRPLVHRHRARAARQSSQGAPHHRRHAHALSRRANRRSAGVAAAPVRGRADRRRHRGLRQQQQNRRGGRELFRHRRGRQLLRGHRHRLSPRHERQNRRGSSLRRRNQEDPLLRRRARTSSAS